ncbi:MAG: protein-glutamate methylesterase/protein-glutamine glutaminase [Rubripirellula sp.]
MNSSPTRILVVDDSALYRQSIHNVLRNEPNAEIVGIAKNGIEALQKIETLDPDLLTLDVQMPDMDGIGVLREIKARRWRTKAIMVSSLTSQNAQVTTDALMEGAFDFILKPSSSDSEANRQQLRDELTSKISAFRDSGRYSRDVSPAVAGRSRDVRHESTGPAPSPKSACRVVMIGTSTGGPAALKAMLPKIPDTLAAPLLIVQHMPAKYTLSLAERLNEICSLEVVEAVNGMEPRSGQAILAAGGMQMKLLQRNGQLMLRVKEDPPVNGLRPSVDYLLHSAIAAVDGDALAVILTGMGRDGLSGCQALKEAGGYVFAQSQSDCVVYGMPKAVTDAKLVDRTLPLAKIAPAIARHVKRSRRS